MEHQHKHQHGGGSGGFCLCPSCGFKKEHEAGIPCREEKCPECGKKMVREGSYHHDKILEKRVKKSNQS